MPGLNLVRIYMYYSNPAAKVCLLLQFCRAMPKGSSVYFTSKKILPFGFSGQNCDPCRPTINTQQTRGIHPKLFQCWASVEAGVPTLKQLWVNAPCLLGSLDLFHDTMCVQAHLSVYYSGGQMLAALAQNVTIIRTTARFQANVFCNVKL